MCIIVVKPKGIALPDKAVLERCFARNPDGAGFMINTGNDVVIEKGFMSWNPFWKRLSVYNAKKDLKEYGMVLHFRIGTSGKKDMGNCHPYPISDNDDDLRKSLIRTELGVAHNGIISEYTPSRDSLLNDTQMFVKEVLCYFYKVDKDFLDDERVIKMLKLLCKSKLAFLKPNGEFCLIGDFEKEDGCYYSNSSYKPSRPFPELSSTPLSERETQSRFPFEGEDEEECSEPYAEDVLLGDLSESAIFLFDGSIAESDTGEQFVCECFGQYVLDDDCLYEVDWDTRTCSLVAIGAHLVK